MAEKLSLGPCTFKIEQVEGGGPSSPVTISHTNEDEDTTLSTEIETFEIRADQQYTPLESRISKINAAIETSIFLDYETLEKICSEWTKGSSGFKLGGVGVKPRIVKVTVIPQGASETNKEHIVFDKAIISSSLNLSLKKEGIANVKLTITSVGEDVLKTGDYA